MKLKHYLGGCLYCENPTIIDNVQRRLVGKCSNGRNLVFGVCPDCYEKSLESIDKKETIEKIKKSEFEFCEKFKRDKKAYEYLNELEIVKVEKFA